MKYNHKLIHWIIYLWSGVLCFRLGYILGRITNEEKQEEKI